MIFVGKCASCGKRGWKFGRWGSLSQVKPYASEGRNVEENACLRCVSMLRKARDLEFRRLAWRQDHGWAAVAVSMAKLDLELWAAREKAKRDARRHEREARRQDIELAVVSALARSKVCPLSR